MPSVENTVKCVVVGDGAVGKTCLLISYAKGQFPKDYVPTVFDNYAVKVDAGGQQVTLNLLDTAGQEDYDRLRPLSYSNANIVLMCYSIANYDSFLNVRDKWYPELIKYIPHTPFILVGTQSDRRESASGKRLIPKSEGERLAKDLGAVSYMECSALTREGVRDVFVEALLTSLQGNQKSASRKKKCSVF